MGMTKTDIIDVAEEQSGVRPPGRLAEEEFDSLYLQWVDRSKPRLVRASGNLASDPLQGYAVPGYKYAIQVTLDGNSLYSLGIDHLYYNESDIAAGNSASSTGFVVHDDKIFFTGNEDDVEEGLSYEVIYYSNNIQLPSGTEPYLPGKLHLHFSNELAIRFRMKYGKNKSERSLTQFEQFERNKNEKTFRTEAAVDGNPTESSVPIQPDQFWTNY